MSFPTAFPSAFGSGGVCPPDSQFGELLVMPITGRTSGTPTNGTVVFSATTDVNVWTTGQAVIVSETRAADDVFRVHTVEISCPNNASGFFVIGDAYKIRSLGNHRGALNPNTDFYAGTAATMPVLALNLNALPSLLQKIRQGVDLGAALVTTGNQPMPAGMTYLQLSGANIAWTYTGALPTGLTFLQLIGANIAWTYTGALPTGLTFLQLIGANIAWTYTGALPTGLAVLQLEGAAINWTGTEFGRTLSPVNYSVFLLRNYRNPSDNMDYAQLIEILDNLRDRAGTLPSTVTIREQIPANVTAIAAATAVELGTDPERAKFKINTLKTTKSITTFTLNTTNI
jgi:hypothetical protein